MITGLRRIGIGIQHTPAAEGILGRTESAMNLALSPEIQKFIEDRVRTGKYATPEAVVQDAIERLQTDEELAALDLDDHTLAAIDEADRQYGRGEFVDLKDVAAELRAKFSGR